MWYIHPCHCLNSWETKIFWFILTLRIKLSIFSKEIWKYRNNRNRRGKNLPHSSEFFRPKSGNDFSVTLKSDLNPNKQKLCVALQTKERSHTWGARWWINLINHRCLLSWELQREVCREMSAISAAVQPPLMVHCSQPSQQLHFRDSPTWSLKQSPALRREQGELFPLPPSPSLIHGLVIFLHLFCAQISHPGLIQCQKTQFNTLSHF